MNNTLHYEPVAFVRTSFVKICEGDGCRAAALNHILYWIGKKAVNETRENIQEGKVLYYATSEELTKNLSNAWGVCKARKEVNTLISDGIIGRGKNPTWGADRTKHFFFGKEQCAKLLELCNKEGICLLHIDLPKEIMHLIKSSNANDKSIKCLCHPPKTEEKQMIDLSNGQSGHEHNPSEQMMKSSEHLIDPSLANDEIIGAITKVSTKITTKDYNLDSKDSSVEKDSENQTLAPDVASLISSLFDQVAKLTTQVEHLTSQLSSRQLPSGDTNVPNTPSPTSSQGPDTPASSSVRDTSSPNTADSSSSAHGMEDIKTVEQKSVQDGQSNLIANRTTKETEKEENDIVLLAIGEIKTDVSDEQKQETLFEVPKAPPVMPLENAKWCPETLVQIVEAKLGHHFEEILRGKAQKTQRQRQLLSAKKIIDAKVTREEFIKAYDDRNDAWWNEANGELTVVDMASNTSKKVMRTLEVLEKLAKKKGKTNNSVISLQERQRPSGSTQPVVSARVSPEKNQRNLERLRQRQMAAGYAE